MASNSLIIGHNGDMSGWGEAKMEVIALVTSAGGVGALSAVLRGLSADLAAAVVVQQHLSVNGSCLTSVLAKRTGLDVVWADDGGRPMPGQVTVCPPRTRMEILPDGSCSLLPSESGAREYPHDGLLTSLADSYGPRAMAVVLTGMGRDGAAGAAAVKAAGGFVIAQSEDTAEHPQMPLAAAAAGAHLMLPLPEIGSAIADVVSGRPLPRPRSEIEAAETLFAGPGEIRQLLRDMDWARTPLGPVTEWPEALRLMVRTTLDAAYPMAVWWGPQLIQIYNQKWRDFLGAKHPRALVGRVRQTWPELWPVISPMIEHVLTHAEAVGDEDFQIFIDRSGYLEEVFVTFSFAPILDMSGTVIGVHNTGWDTTKNVVGERRMRALRAVAAGAAGASGPEEAAEAAAAALASDPADVPFALFYLIDHARQQGRLTAVAGLDPGSAAAPRIIDFSVSGGGGIWPLASLLRERQQGSARPNGDGVLVEDLDERLRGPLIPAAAGTLSPRSAFLLPLRITAEEPPAGVLVAGVSPHLPFDDLYRGFLDLIAGQVSAGLAQAQARHRERQRLERLAELDRAKAEFFSNVSHEFRTPLTLMLGPLEEMLRDQMSLPPGLADDLELIRRNARRLLRLVGALLDFSQAEAGRLRAHFVPVDLAERTRAIVAQFESAAKRAGLKLGATLDPLPEPAWIDPEMWEKIVAHLLSNALKFTFTGGIDVTLRALPAHAELVIRDTGAGIPAGELPHIFKRFHRVRDTRARTQEGAGIGLALADELVRRHHGRIRAASVAGEGSTFTVWIPLGRRPGMPEDPPPDPGTPGSAFAAAMAEEASRWDADTAVAADNPSAFETASEPAPGRGSARPAARARVLVVDDNQDMRDYLARLLGTQWQVSAARDGGEALLLARRDPPDIIVSDVMMPGLDGFALLRAIRRDEDLAATPVVLLTARTGEENAIEGLLAGAGDYVVKPFSAREMLARVAAQLELSRARFRAAGNHAFRVRLTDALRDGAGQRDIETRGTGLLREHLNCATVLYGGAGDDPVYRAELAAGRTVVVHDVAADQALAEPIRARYAQSQVGSFAMVPVMRDGRPVAVMCAQDKVARTWRDDEVLAIAAAADRTWQEIERARAEAALRASQRRLRYALETEAVGVLYFDHTGTVVDANDVFLRMTGYAKAEVERGELSRQRMTAPEHVPANPEQLDHLAAAGRIGPYEMEYFVKDGTRRWMLIVGRDIGDGAVREFCIDITDLKRAEEANRDPAG